jgi:DNA invertase Pin-like site-specific DNA recombinase
MDNKIQLFHQQKMAFVYLRQSTMYQVIHNLESTNRRYALQEKALQLGWNHSRVRILDSDLGQSGSHASGREDFKLLVAEVSMGNVGAIFVLEASRLSRSSADWNRLLELCSLTRTLIIDQDGCYDPGLFNDQLLLGLKGTMSQAELHLIRARLHGAKLNKAQRGELRFPIPVGYVYNDRGNITVDPDAQVCHCIQLLFSVFKEKQTAYAVVHYFANNRILFPKRAHGGRWNGKLRWGKLTHERALSILKHPFYAGIYTFGRYKSIKKINAQGEIVSCLKMQPEELWQVKIKDHHPQYISDEQYQDNIRQLQVNMTASTQKMLPGPPREGATLLQGLLVCGGCGRKISIRYVNNKKIIPTYECNWRKRQGLTGSCCVRFRADIVDPVIEQKVIQALSPENVNIALKAFDQMEQRNTQLSMHWQMNLQRCRYNADIAQRRFEQVDPANRLVAASLERAWNQELEKLVLAENEYRQYMDKKQAEFPANKTMQISDLAKQIPSLWNKTTNIKDKKRIVRLLINDITVSKGNHTKELLLNIRWLTDHTEQIPVDLPLNIADKVRYPQIIIDKVRALTLEYADDKRTMDILNRQGIPSATGKPFTRDMIQWIRFKYKIKMPLPRLDDEFSIKEVRAMFNISGHMVYYWIKNQYVQARKTPANTLLVKITPQNKKQLAERIKNSCKVKYMTQPGSIIN